MVEVFRQSAFGVQVGVSEAARKSPKTGKGVRAVEVLSANPPRGSHGMLFAGGVLTDN